MATNEERLDGNSHSMILDASWHIAKSRQILSVRKLLSQTINALMSYQMDVRSIYYT